MPLMCSFASLTSALVALLPTGNSPDGCTAAAPTTNMAEARAAMISAVMVLSAATGGQQRTRNATTLPCPEYPPRLDPSLRRSVLARPGSPRPIQAPRGSPHALRAVAAPAPAAPGR
eukprot:7170149-Prymnesium_polylepis.2